MTDHMTLSLACLRRNLRIQLNLSTTATLGTEESDRCEEVAVMGRYGCNMTPFFQEVQHVYCAKFMLTVAYNGNPILNNIFR